ncbi:MAG: hypothetical protein V4674_01405 [Patescibacteria group bacterium]
MTKRGKDESGPKRPEESEDGRTPFEGGESRLEQDRTVLRVLDTIEDEILDLQADFEDAPSGPLRDGIDGKIQALENQRALFRDFYKKGMSPDELSRSLDAFAESKAGVTGIRGAEALVLAATHLARRVRMALIEKGVEEDEDADEGE